ncbi:MAG: hypothetical protein ACETWG_11190 [Candidatus Neomarinimicrobiota bacterium]
MPVKLIIITIGAIGLLSCSAISEIPGQATISFDDTIRFEDIQARSAPNTLALIEELRPYWLRGEVTEYGEGSNLIVYVDRIRIGGVRELAHIPISSIEQIRFLTPSEASIELGETGVDGAILVITR